LASYILLRCYTLLMKNIWLSFLVVLSIALQSFTAVANVEQIHQVDIKHLQTQHSHDSDIDEFLNDASDNQHNSKDCHHCGHCQGSHSPWVMAKPLDNFPSDILVSQLYFYLTHPNNRFIEDPIRPPIA
jgi:hypothetical protein